MSETQDLLPVRRALLSVSDKTGLAEFATGLSRYGIALISTGGTAKALREAGLPASDVAELTGFPEMLDGRVKTLHPKVHGGLLGRRDLPSHQDAMAEHGIVPIDLVAIDLYPFERTLASGAGSEAVIENIDIGGPAMLRSAAKNHAFVAVLTRPGDYAEVLAELAATNGALSLALRRRLAARAFARTASYDAAIARWFQQQANESLPERFSLAGRRAELLRYGENPHQQAAFYVAGEPRPGVASARQVQGKALSYNNLNDTDAAYEAVAEFDDGPACVIVKHANPCGAAVSVSLREAYLKALACDPLSAFGGVVAFNRPLDAATARETAKLFTEVIVAPDADAQARAVIAEKKNLRLLLAGGLPDPTAPGLTLKTLAGGFLVQTRDAGRVAAGDLKVVTKRRPSAAELADLLFAFRVAKHVKSNAIVYARNGQTVGVGAGQMSRVDAARIAAQKAREAAEAAGEQSPRTVGAVAASDAFFPFADGLLATAAAGVTAVIQPGGSLRDGEVIAAADQAGLAMVFTGLRHFRH
ncbi:MAG: bifunctional phosphoribosylaminoimidazolecarboxamide formyltransferase/IMP cyclohydrolase [Alphaproteobacteria bacterium]|nr:bifunctional phosphoribosylaminoimidazolecarboxamide formyltransferase/IMP cyclohydrolase [Alphaproteobacteria bacterium]